MKVLFIYNNNFIKENISPENNKTFYTSYTKNCVYIIYFLFLFRMYKN